MAGFGKVAFIGEYFNQKIVNVLHYRSTEWLPNQGNPFDDVLAFVDAVVAEVKTPLLNCLPSDYTLRTVEGTGYDSAYNIVTSAPLIRSINEAGALTGLHGMGAAPTSIVSLRCGSQVQINNVGQSKRNRGYLAVGPMMENNVDDYSHIDPAVMGRLDALAQHLDNTLTIVLPAVQLIPIRIHEKWNDILGAKVLAWRTYSDVLGYRVSNVVSYRRSRRPEA